MARDLAILVGAFAGGTLLAWAFGADNAGVAATFGSIAFVIALVAHMMAGSGRRGPGPGEEGSASQRRERRGAAEPERPARRPPPPAPRRKRRR